MIKVIVDTVGGDLSPDANLEGAVKALNSIEDLYIIFAGNENLLKEKLANYTYDANRVEFLNATEEITCNDQPTLAIRQKKDSSIVKAFELMHSDDTVNAFVSTGSTGAILVGTVMKVGRSRGVKRPAFCPILPTMNGKIVGICDSGANVDCDSLQLSQFALMSSLYLQKTYNIESPRVALLNVGVEEEKGDMLRKDTYQILKNSKQINFVGNMESRDLLKGKYDVVVCDGFAGNVLLKSTEGACLEMLKMVKGICTKSLKTKIGALFLKKDIMEAKDFMDYNNYGGAVLLGAAKTIVKGHGSSKAVSIFHCIEQAYNMEKSSLRTSIADAITKETSLGETNE
ncbi:MAG: phosphate acyltransferase PlsX [Clostridia bacterium]|nr:phosphate acyltransferase PlsX [Clostridia bacterium]